MSLLVSLTRLQLERMTATMSWREATKLETQGRVQEALAAYQRVADKYPDTAAGRDARKSIESLRAIIS